MKNYAVIGLGFGDEGKGFTTDFLCSHGKTKKLVIRFSGGQQAGHTVKFDGMSHIFSNFGAGTLRGHPTYWSKYCTLDPVSVMRELKILKEKGITPTLYIDEDSPITIPLDKLRNQGVDMSNGTCGTGVGTTWEREESFYSLRAIDLQHPTAFKIKLDLILSKYYNLDLDTIVDDLNLNSYIAKFYSACVSLVSEGCISIVQRKAFFARPDIQISTKIFEGSQGLLLDQNIGFFPHVTRSNTDTTNVLKMLKKRETLDLFLVTRAYQTRHGNGPMTNLDRPSPNIEYADETNVKNKYQGEFKKTILDVDLLRYAIAKETNLRKNRLRFDSINLVITCSNHITDNNYQFTHRGRLYEFDDVETFATDLVTRLPLCINSLYLSSSDTYEGMRKLILL